MAKIGFESMNHNHIEYAARLALAEYNEQQAELATSLGNIYEATFVSYGYAG